MNTDLVVDPGLIEMAARLHVAPVDGLPLLRLTQPTFVGVPPVLKNIVDRVGAGGHAARDRPPPAHAGPRGEMRRWPGVFRQPGRDAT